MTTTLIRNVKPAGVIVSAGRIAAIGAGSGRDANHTVIDGRGGHLSPGLVDLQLNGGFGFDFTTDPASVWTVAERLPRHGVTSFLPTIISSPLAAIDRARQVLLDGPPAGWRGAVPLGWHVEGPFLSPRKPGAHNPAHLLLPDLAAVRGWTPAGGVRLVTLAPELPGALPVIETLAARGVIVSAGHSMATTAEARAGIAAGVRCGTHLFNAMPPLHHREPGLVGALLDSDLPFGLIADGLHVDPLLVRLLHRLAGPRLLLVTDAMAALGMPPGVHHLGDRAVHVTPDSARLDDGTLAGSIIGMDEGVRRFSAMIGGGESGAQAALQASNRHPAALLADPAVPGELRVGARADLVILSPELRVTHTFVNGELLYVAN